MPITVTITPAQAVQAGACWRVLFAEDEPGEWLASGTVVSAHDPRRYRVEFSSIPGWRTPAPIWVRNVTDFTNRNQGSYQQLTAYELGQISPQSALHGQTLEFMLPRGEALTVNCEPTPVGEVSYDAATGAFRYLPADDDKLPFSVTLQRTLDKATQTFLITPMPILAPEVLVFGCAPVPEAIAVPNSIKVVPEPARHAVVMSAEAASLPPPAEPVFQSSSLTLASFLDEQPMLQPLKLAATPPAMAPMQEDLPDIQIEANAEEVFNYETRETKNIRIIGNEISLQKGSEAYDLLHQNPAIKRLEIYAECLTICGPLHLPQTNVTIFARELHFEDTPEADACIKTTPLAFTTAAKPATRLPQKDASGKVILEPTGQEKCVITPADNGRAGAKAGDLKLYIEACFDDAAKTRFILSGGQGQDPGEGMQGRNGPLMNNQQNYNGADPGTIWRIVYGEYVYKRSFWYKTQHHYFGTKAWPTDGEPGIPGGIPGNGGNGGNFSAAIDLAAIADVRGGRSGAQHGYYAGGAPGQPQYSVMVHVVNTTDAFTSKKGWSYIKHEDQTSHITKNGQGVNSPVGADGSAGQKQKIAHALSWMHSLLLHDVLRRANSDHLSGKIENARVKLSEYVELLDIYQTLDAWNVLDTAEQLEIQRLHNEMSALLARMDMHMDYFGNPAGWVPMLSFEVNLTLFENEIDRSMDILYMTYWLRNKAANDQQRVTALQTLTEKLKTQIESLKADYAKTTESIPGLETEAARIANETNLLQQKLQQLEDELRHKAEEQLEQPWWKTGLKIAGKLCSIIPVWQPALGAVGGVMNLAADFDKDDPWKTITGTADVAASFSEARFSQKKADFGGAAKKVDTKSKEFQALESAKHLAQATSTLSKGMQGVAGVIAERQAPKSEVDALLLKLEAESAEFKKLSGEISSMLERKMEFAQKLTDALHAMVEIPNTITAHLLAIDSANSAIEKGRNVLQDGRLAMHLDAMEQRAKERLLKYHYYVAKSYEYRLLQRYPGSLDLDKIVMEMKKLAELNMDSERPHELSAQQFNSLKGIYRDAIAQIIDDILNEFRNKPTERHTPVLFSLAPEEIDLLNKGETVTLNPMALGLFKLQEENIRITDIDIEAPTVHLRGTGKRGLAELDLRFEHRGISQLRVAGRTIRFLHTVRENFSPITWATRYHVIDKRLDAIKPSAASNSLLRALLKSDSVNDMMLYSRPAAWADISIHREINAEPGVEITIEDLRIKIGYDFSYASFGGNTLRVATAPLYANLQPYVVIDREDINGRSDGRGEFYRAYEGLPELTLEAQAVYGRWKFSQWTDRAGQSFGKTPRVKIKLDVDQELFATYVLETATSKTARRHSETADETS